MKNQCVTDEKKLQSGRGNENFEKWKKKLYPSKYVE